MRDSPSRRETFRAIYEAHHAAVCAYFARRAPRDDVEDLAAEWLYAVTRNVLANHRRRAARRGELTPDPATGDPPSD